MSNLIYPALPGLSIESKRSILGQTSIRTSAAGLEYRATYSAYPRYLISLSYELLRAGALAELQTLQAFFESRGVDYDDFLFDDAKDNACTDQQFATGDGLTTTFRLSRARIPGAPQIPVSATYGTPVIKKAGIVQSSGVTIDANAGKVTFATAPTTGQALSWSGSYYWRCRFKNNAQEFEQFLWDLWKTQKVELITVKTT